MHASGNRRAPLGRWVSEITAISIGRSSLDSSRHFALWLSRLRRKAGRSLRGLEVRVGSGSGCGKAREGCRRTA
jgi:hypothetical protein